MTCRTLTTPGIVRKTRVLLFLAVAVVLVGCSNAPHVVSGPAEFEGSGRHAVYIANHGWHTGVIVPAEAMQERVPALQKRFPEARHLEFGWGDKDFYQAPEMSVTLALKAILWPTDAVTRVVGIREPIRKYARDAGLVGLCVDDQSLQALLTFLETSFAPDPAGDLQLSQAESGRSSQFYEGAGHYHLFNTCNTWTAKSLKSMGMDLSPALKLTSGSVMDYLFQHPDAVRLSVYRESESTHVQSFRCDP
jgi:uncharacterized protein (TIGR02117 family)